MPGGGHSHRAGGLRQSNKKNKRSRASKRSVHAAAGGRVNNGRRSNQASMLASTKADRRHHQQQKREAKRKELLKQKRSGVSSPPRVIGLVSLGRSTELEERVRDAMVEAADSHQWCDQQRRSSSVTCKFDKHKKDGVLTILTCGTAFLSDTTTIEHGDDNDDDAMVMAALDLARVCDSLLFLIDSDSPRVEVTITEINMDNNDQQSASTSKTTSQSWDHLISDRGDRILSAIKGQGLPTPVTVLAQTTTAAVAAVDDGMDDQMTVYSCKSVRRSKLKRHADLKKYVSRFATTEFGNDNNKVAEINLAKDDDEMEEDNAAATMITARESSASVGALVRTLCSMACAPPKWVGQCPRAFVLSDSYEYRPECSELCVTGFVRGKTPLDIHSLYHVPGIGTFACKEVTKATPPLTKKHLMPMIDATTTTQTTSSSSSLPVVVMANPDYRESLNRYATPDALDGEQNLIGFDDDDMNNNNNSGDESVDEEAFARPVGWSDYQSAWLDAVDEDAIDGADMGQLAEELNTKKSSASVMTDGMDLEDVNEVSEQERQELIEQRKKQLNDEQDFPDEVQVKEDEKARDRFARYRSLKSFRQSHWDPKENLPDSFSSIFHFSSFRQTQRTVMNDMKALVSESDAVTCGYFGKSPAKALVEVATKDDNDMESDEDDLLEGCIPKGSYVTLTLENVPKSAVGNVGAGVLLTAVTLLPHENKISVLHMGLSQTAGCDATDDAVPIKSKDVLTFRCGWRTWKARPVFSQNNLNCDKHKYERFLPTGGAFFAASIFGPVTYTPSPVLVFREKGAAANGACVVSRRELVAVGSMMGADADRIVVKRIILTGYPVRVHKRHATVKYMFYDPEDVKWFKPAGLHTKHGLQGNIVQSVGEHGTMKCLFNAPIKQHDTVCLPLYKRIFPKYSPVDEEINKSSSTYRESNSLVIL